MFNPKLYREACRELRAPGDKIEEVITMTENSKKKFRRPLRTALICAAAAAMMVVGVSAANPGMIEAVTVRIGKIIQVDSHKMEMYTEDGSKITVFSAPQAAVENRDGRAILVIDGEDAADITDELNAEGRCRYEGVVGERPLTVTVEGTAEEWTTTVTIDDPNSTISYSNNSTGSDFASVPSTFTKIIDDTDVYVSVSIQDSEALDNVNASDIISKYKDEISKAIPEN